jgi:hypothetical protein
VSQRRATRDYESSPSPPEHGIDYTVDFEEESETDLSGTEDVRNQRPW